MTENNPMTLNRLTTPAIDRFLAPRDRTDKVSTFTVRPSGWPSLVGAKARPKTSKAADHHPLATR
jgi:hypothetical protein